MMFSLRNRLKEKQTVQRSKLLNGLLKNRGELIDIYLATQDFNNSYNFILQYFELYTNDFGLLNGYKSSCKGQTLRIREIFCFLDSLFYSHKY